MKSSEIRELSTQEIMERIDSEENLLIRMKMNHAVSPLDNPNKIPETRRNIARLKTELRARQSAPAEGESKE
jgi:large subunit ribosomal protein L29